MNSFDDLASNVVRRWVRLYTGRLGLSHRERRLDEIESDLWEHRREARAAGLGPTQTGIEIVGRWLLGIPADLAWRRASQRMGRADDGRDPVMSTDPGGSWWAVSPLVLAGLHLFAGIANLDPGWTPPQPAIDPMAIVVLVLGVSTIGGVVVWNRAPKLAGVLVLSGVWVPLFTPVYNLAVRLFRISQSTVGGPSEYLGAFGIVIAVLTVVGAIQNMARRPTRSRHLSSG
jgi:hypothetical protein